MDWRIGERANEMTGGWFWSRPAALLAARRGYYYPFFYAYFAAYPSCSTPRLAP